MPEPNSISSEEKAWIKYDIQEAFNIQIEDASSRQNLPDKIFKKVNRQISDSTIRRFFGLVPSSSLPSIHTLNTLAIAVGFKNWDTYKIHLQNFVTNTVNQRIQIYSRKLPNSSAIIYETVKKLPITAWTEAYQFQNIVSIAIENKDFELLAKIVQLTLDANNKTVYEYLVIGFQSFYFQSLNGNKDVINFVTTNISNSILLQKCLLQAYVDENYLDGFFGEWIEAITTNTLLPDVLLFKNLLLCQKCWRNQKREKAKEYLNHSLQSQIDPSQKHPILKARIGVWTLILNKDENTLSEYFTKLKNPFDKADFVVIASRLLWTYHNEKQPIPFINNDNLDIKDFPIVKDFFQKGRYNVLLLTLAINSFLQDDIVKAKEYFGLFNPSDFAYDIVNIDFYSTWITELERKLIH